MTNYYRLGVRADRPCDLNLRAYAVERSSALNSRSLAL